MNDGQLPIRRVENHVLSGAHAGAHLPLPPGQNRLAVVALHAEGARHLTGGQRVKPHEVAALVDDHRARGALALVGAWGDVEDAAIDAFLNEVLRSRAADTGRPVRLEQ